MEASADNQNAEAGAGLQVATCHQQAWACWPAVVKCRTMQLLVGGSHLWALDKEGGDLVA